MLLEQPAQADFGGIAVEIPDISHDANALHLGHEAHGVPAYGEVGSCTEVSAEARVVLVPRHVGVDVVLLHVLCLATEEIIYLQAAPDHG